MKTNAKEQSAVWQSAFVEGLVRGEAAFGHGHNSALGYAESYAYLIEAEQLNATPVVSPEAAIDEARTGWAKAFRRLR